MPVQPIRTFYEESGAEMFDKASLLRRFRSKYEDAKLAERFKPEIGEQTTLSGEELKTLLLIWRSASRRLGRRASSTTTTRSAKQDASKKRAAISSRPCGTRWTRRPSAASGATATTCGLI